MKNDGANADALNNLGYLLVQRGQPGDGLPYIERALQVRENPLFHVNAAKAHRALGRTQAAEDALLQALEGDPDSEAAHRELGVLYRTTGNHRRSIYHYQQVAKAKPEDAAARIMVATVCREAGDDKRAAQYAREALAIDPRNGSALANLGVAEWRQGNRERALTTMLRAVANAGDDPEACFLPAMVLINAGELAGARDLLELALQAQPNAPVALQKLAEVQEALQDFAGEEATLNRLLALKPDAGQARMMLLHALDKQNKHADANAAARRMTPEQIPPRTVSSFVNACAKVADYETLRAAGSVYDIMGKASPDRLASQLGLNAVRAQTRSDDDVRAYVQLQRTWCQHLKQQARAAPIDGPARTPRERIRLGLFGLSNIPALRSLITPVLGQLDGDRFERVLAFSSSKNALPQQERNRIANTCDEFHELTAADDHQLARDLAELDLDVLIDLNGLQQPGTRIGALAWRPAGVQMTWAGTPSSCPLGPLDYQILDPVLAPDEPDYQTDSPLTMPQSWVCFGDMPDFELAETLPSAAKGHVTFGVNGPPDKFNEDTIAQWARILREMPDARLLFLNPQYGQDLIRDNVKALFDRHGVGERVDFNGEKAPQRRHMLNYNDVDVLLDNHPLCGGIGLLEALHMGVPAVTLKGKVIQHRLGASQLTAAGLSDLCVGDWDAYVATAVKLAQDESRRRELRSSLRGTMRGTSFVNMAKFMGEFQEKMAEVAGRR